MAKTLPVEGYGHTPSPQSLLATEGYAEVESVTPSPISPVISEDVTVPILENKFQIIRFIHKPIVDADKSEGDLFLHRFFQQPQIVWNRILSYIAVLPKTNSPSEMQNSILLYAKDLVGFTKELSYITEGLSDDDLRRVIISAIKLWKNKGSETGYKLVLQVFTGKAPRIFNYFQFQFILGDTVIGQEEEGKDPYLLSSPEDFGDVIGIDSIGDEFFTEIRIVDSILTISEAPNINQDDLFVRSLDRRLVLQLLNLMRPVNERILVLWVDFFDNFSQGLISWNVPIGSTATTEANIYNTLFDLILSPSSIIVSSILEDTKFKHYLFSSKIKIDTSTSGIFYLHTQRDQTTDTGYVVEITYDSDTPANQQVRLIRRDTGADTVLITTSPLSFTIFPDIYYIHKLSIQLNDNRTKQILKYTIDGNEVFTYEDTDLSTALRGKWGYETDSSTTLRIQFAEVT